MTAPQPGADRPRYAVNIELDLRHRDLDAQVRVLRHDWNDPTRAAVAFEVTQGDIRILWIADATQGAEIARILDRQTHRETAPDAPRQDVPQ